MSQKCAQRSPQLFQEHYEVALCTIVMRIHQLVRQFLPRERYRTVI